MAGYSGTPLAGKLGIKEGFAIAFVQSPDGFAKTLGDLPLGVTVSARTSGAERGRNPATQKLDLVLSFTKSKKRLPVSPPFIS